MSAKIDLREQAALVVSLLWWCLLGTCVGVFAGTASAVFLAGLAWATTAREATPSLLWLLPIAGAAIGLVYSRYGKDLEDGNNLLLERIHSAQGDVSWRMAPFIALSTIGTHLFGGSAGREGTAVQMGGCLADLFARTLRLCPADRRILLMSGISGGFGSIFGTPLAGSVFGLEVLAVGRIRYDALVPCFIASTVGDLVCRGLGIDHHLYSVGVAPHVTPSLLLWTTLAGASFGAASLLFAELTHAVRSATKLAVARPWLRPALGGVAVIGLTYLAGSRDYLGLSLHLIEASFTPQGVFLGAFALKSLFTAVTLGTGFKGGEVTPLFCIGATLGYAFAWLSGQPTAVFAALGFVAVFAGAANTPLACVLMGIELFGADLAVPLTLACIVSYITSGHRGIYLSQQLDTPKASTMLIPDGVALRDAYTGVCAIDTTAFRRRPANYNNRREENMTHKKPSTPINSSPFGQLRIFLRTGDKLKATTWRGRLKNPPIYLRVLKKAREFGLAHGTAKHCVSGFIDQDQVQIENSEYGNMRLPIYIELHGSREMLERFCVESPELLEGRLIIYKDVERWGWQSGAFFETPLVPTPDSRQGESHVRQFPRRQGTAGQ